MNATVCVGGGRRMRVRVGTATQPKPTQTANTQGTRGNETASRVAKRTLLPARRAWDGKSRGSIDSTLSRVTVRTVVRVSPPGLETTISMAVSPTTRSGTSTAVPDTPPIVTDAPASTRVTVTSANTCTGVDGI